MIKKTLLVIGIGLFTIALNAQIERAKWEIGGGVRFNYMGLDGGYEGER